MLGLLVTAGFPALQTPPASELAVRYSPIQERGRALYLREGCMYCHTQQVRAIEVGIGTVVEKGDIGPESQPGDYALQKPVSWGTNRQGPDLSHAASRPYGASKVWQITHLQAPRSIRPGSLMPAYAHLPPEDLNALAEYLLTLR